MTSDGRLHGDASRLTRKKWDSSRRIEPTFSEPSPEETTPDGLRIRLASQTARTDRSLDKIDECVTSLREACADEPVKRQRPEAKLAAAPRTVRQSPAPKQEQAESAAAQTGDSAAESGPANGTTRDRPAGDPQPAADTAGDKKAQQPREPESKTREGDPTGKATPERSESKADVYQPGKLVLEGDTGPVVARPRDPDGKAPKTIDGGGGTGTGGGGRGGGGGGGQFHKRLGPVDFSASLKAGKRAIKKNLVVVMLFTVATNVLVLAIPVYLFQISDRVLTSRSYDTLIMLTAVIVLAVILQAAFDAIRRFVLMRTAVELAVQLGSPVLSAAARASLHSNGKEYQVLGDLQQLRQFLVSGTLLSFLDVPMAPLFFLAVFFVHPQLGWIVVIAALALLFIALINQRATSAPFADANQHLSRANLHLDSMSRNSQIINAMAMIPEAVKIWGRDTAQSLTSQVKAQDRNIVSASFSKGSRMLTQVALLGWGANLAIAGEITGGMVIAASIIAGRALSPIEGAIEGWNNVIQSRAAYSRITSLLTASPMNFERLELPRPEGRLDVERLLFVPQGTKRVVLNGISLSLQPGESLAIIGNSGAGKSTLGKMLVGSILPTSGNVRLDLMDLRNWDQRQFGENIGYLPQDVQLFPGSIKANIARMREDATDEAIFEAAKLADVHELIANFAQGYETFVAGDGTPLSGGQKQRIALARAFFGNPRLVVLDEPNSNLDSDGEAALARAMQHAKKNRITVVTITQRPSLLQSVDKILLLTNGTVTMFGTREEVLKALTLGGSPQSGISDDRQK